MKESNIQKQIQLNLSKKNILTFRTNAGTFYAGNLIRGDITVKIGNNPPLKCNSILINPRIAKGLPEGFSDLIAVAPEGKTIFIETKTLKGRQRDAQKKFQQAIESRNHVYKIARKIEDIENDLK